MQALLVIILLIGFINVGKKVVLFKDTKNNTVTKNESESKKQIVSKSELNQTKNTKVESFEEKKEKRILSARYYRPKNGTTSIMDNEVEMEIFKCLNQIVGTRFTLLAHIPLKDLFENVSKKEWYVRSGNEYLWGFHLDFVICSNYYLVPLIAIELDGKQHESEEQQLRDLFKDELLKNHNIPVLRLKVEDVIEKEVNKITVRTDVLKDRIQEVLASSTMVCNRCGARYRNVGNQMFCPNKKCKNDKKHSVNYKYTLLS